MYPNPIVTNNETGEQASVQVINNMNNEAMSQIASDLEAGSPSQQKMGKQFRADMVHMRDVKKSGMTWQDDGQIRLPGTVEDKQGNKLSAQYVKTISPVDGTPSWKVQIFNKIKT